MRRAVAGAKYLVILIALSLTSCAKWTHYMHGLDTEDELRETSMDVYEVAFISNLQSSDFEEFEKANPGMEPDERVNRFAFNNAHAKAEKLCSHKNYQFNIRRINRTTAIKLNYVLPYKFTAAYAVGELNCYP